MDIKDFLGHYVDGYLIGDIIHIDGLGPLPGATVGAAGYPLVLATLAGMELLGMLVGKSPLVFAKETPESGSVEESQTKKAEPGSQYFNRYWSHVFVKVDARYRRFGDLARYLLRNPLAHSGLTTSAVVITKGPIIAEAPPFARSPDNTYIFVDSSALARDFVQSYLPYVRPTAFGTNVVSTEGHISNRTEMQRRLDELSTHLETEQEARLSGLSVKATTLKPPFGYNDWKTYLETTYGGNDSQGSIDALASATLQFVSPPARPDDTGQEPPPSEKGHATPSGNYSVGSAPSSSWEGGRTTGSIPTIRLQPGTGWVIDTSENED